MITKKIATKEVKVEELLADCQTCGMAFIISPASDTHCLRCREQDLKTGILKRKKSEGTTSELHDGDLYC